MVLYTVSTHTSIRDECESRIGAPNHWHLDDQTEEYVAPSAHVQACPSGYTPL